MHKAELTARHNLEQALLTNQAEKQLIRNGALPGLLDANSSSLPHRAAKSAKGNKTTFGAIVLGKQSRFPVPLAVNLSGKGLFTFVVTCKPDSDTGYLGKEREC